MFCTLAADFQPEGPWKVFLIILGTIIGLVLLGYSLS